MTSPTDNPPTGAIEQIYEKLVSVLGGTNHNQFFTMTVPGTMLNQSDFAYDTTKEKPARVAEAESRLVDQMFDIADVTGSGNGQRVSSQYLRALSVLVPKFSPITPMMKSKLRSFLASPAPADATVDGKPFSGSLSELYFALYESWLAKKAAWDRLVIDRRHTLSNEEFLEWYEGVAETELAVVDAAEGRLVSVFAPSDMNAILGALASGPGGDVHEASTQVLDLRLPSPSGGYVYPVDLNPSNWFLALASDQDPVDLLDDPQFISLSLAGRRQALQATIGQVQTMVSQMPAEGAIAAAGKALAAAQNDYTAAQSGLLDQYAANTVTAVEMYLAKTSGASQIARAVEGLDADVATVSDAMGEKPPATRATTAGGSPLSAEDFRTLLDGHQKLIDAQAKLVTSAQALADAGLNLASEQARTFGDLPAMLTRLQAQLAEVTALQSQLQTAVQNPQPRAVPDKVVDDTTAATATKIIKQSRAGHSSAVAWLQDLFPLVNESDSLKPVYPASAAAWAKYVADAVTKAVNEVDRAASKVHAAAQAASGQRNATTDTVKDAITDAIAGVSSAAVRKVLEKIPTQAANATSAADAARLVDVETGKLATEGEHAVTLAQNAVSAARIANVPSEAPKAGDKDGVTAALETETLPYLKDYLTGATGGVTAVATASPAAAGIAAKAAADLAAGFRTEAESTGAAPSPAADRWMDLRFSFTSSQMTSSEQESTLSSSTSWRVGLFFGSASGNSAVSKSDFERSALSSDTAIQIGMKATKVDISRAWFDPGIFKLSRNMHRLTAVPVSLGTPNDRKQEHEANDAILPCFPVSFVVVKDVTIRFQVQESQLTAVQSLLDSRSAVGGGFLCFSASSASAAHSRSSSLSTRSDSTTVTINMPGAQILGWFCEYTPKDGSSLITYPPTQAAGELDIIQFVEAVRQLTGGKPEPETVANANGRRPAELSRT